MNKHHKRGSDKEEKKQPAPRGTGREEAEPQGPFPSGENPRMDDRNPGGEGDAYHPMQKGLAASGNRSPRERLMGGDFLFYIQGTSK